MKIEVCSGAGTMVVLYEHPLSPYAQKVKIALGEKGVAFESRLPDFFGSDPHFAAANPRREVPALVDGETTVFDSTIILEYVEDRWPKPPLLPPDPAGRARARMIEELCDTYYEAINWAGFEVQVFGRAKGELADRLLARATEQRAGANAWLERQLGERPYFNGDAFGWADLSVVPVLSSSAALGDPPRPGSRLATWLERVIARPSVVATLEAGQAAMASFGSVAELVESGQFKREYRDHRLDWMMRSGGADIVLEGMRRGNIRFTAELG